MSLYLSIKMYRPDKKDELEDMLEGVLEGGPADMEAAEAALEEAEDLTAGPAESGGMERAAEAGPAETAEAVNAAGKSEEGAASKDRLLRSIDVSLEKGYVVIESVSSDVEQNFTAELNEQLSNEFLIQVEMLDIKKWNPLYYSPAFAGDVRCRWTAEYAGLKGESMMHSGDDSYPKGWSVLIDLIDSFNEHNDLRQESVRIASDYADMVHGTDLAGMVDMVNILSQMRMPQDVIAAGIFRTMMKTGELDMDYVRKYYNWTVTDLLGEYGEAYPSEPETYRMDLLEHVKVSDSLYFKRLVLAEVLSDLIAVKAKLDRGEGFFDPYMDRESLGLYYAEMISLLGELEKDKRAGVMYSKLVDLYKCVFVSYSLDSVRGAIYQTQGTTAGVMLKRGEYDWKPIQDDVPDDAAPVTKDFALFLADLWKHEADEQIVKDGNREGERDIQDITVLKVIMGKANGRRARKDNEVAISVLTRMMAEGEQILAAMRAGDMEKELIENGRIDDVSRIPVSFLGLEDDEGRTMAAVFTSVDELGELNGADIEAIPVEMVFRFVKNMKQLDGIIIDPFTSRFTVSQEKIAEALDELNKEETGM